jgi:hypothetical protein
VAASFRRLTRTCQTRRFDRPGASEARRALPMSVYLEAMRSTLAWLVALVILAGCGSATRTVTRHAGPLPSSPAPAADPNQGPVFCDHTASVARVRTTLKSRGSDPTAVRARGGPSIAASVPKVGTPWLSRGSIQTVVAAGRGGSSAKSRWASSTRALGRSRSATKQQTGSWFDRDAPAPELDQGSRRRKREIARPGVFYWMCGAAGWPSRNKGLTSR